MSNRTSIEWAANADGAPGATWNPIRASHFDTREKTYGESLGFHCVHVSEGCRNCYAERLNVAARFPGHGTGLAYTKQNEAHVRIFLDEQRLAVPLKRRKPATYFLSNMTDVFADFVTDDMLDKLFAVMALCPQHTFIVLTKRAERMRAWFAERWQGTPARIVQVAGKPFQIPAGGETGRRSQVEEACEEFISRFNLDDTDREDLWTPEGSLRIMQWQWPLPNVWLVVSVEDQRNADERIPHLLATPAAVRGVSCEPLLGSIDLTRLYHHEPAKFTWLAGGGARLNALTGNYPLEESDSFGFHPRRLNWVICGGESGRNARPMHPAWARSLRDQCAAAGVPFFFKQWGEHLPVEIAPDESCAVYDDTVAEGSMRRIDSRPRVTAFDGQAFAAIGKARAGRLLDGVEHNGRPPFTAIANRKGEALATRSASPGRPE